MSGWKSPGRAKQVVIYEEEGDPHHYWRSEDKDGNVLWREDPALSDGKTTGNTMSTPELVKALEASVVERRKASRGRRFRMPLR
jgi:hypothetical protein